MAEKEEGAVDNGDYKRRETLKDQVHTYMLALIGVVGTCVMLAIVIWFYHLLTPVEWHLLKDDQLRRIETVIFGGALAGLIRSHLAKQLTPEPSDR